MRDISQKIKTFRTAVAKATIKVSPKTIDLIRRSKMPKGNPFPVAKVAAIQAAKNTSQIIPYCHPIPVDFVDCQFKTGKNSIEITTTVKAIYKTGVEMEALTAVSVAALTVYDMAKAVDETMRITGISLLSKRGGKSDFAGKRGVRLKAAVLVLSDSVSKGKKKDTSGKFIVARLEEHGIKIIGYRVIPDDPATMQKLLLQYTDNDKADFVITTGGTGVGPRDFTPEATERVIEREIPGIAETLRAYGQERMPFSMLSRGKAGVRGHTLIVNLPGSKKSVEESMAVLLPAILHSAKITQGGGH